MSDRPSGVQFRIEIKYQCAKRRLVAIEHLADEAISRTGIGECLGRHPEHPPQHADPDE